MPEFRVLDNTSFIFHQGFGIHSRRNWAAGVDFGLEFVQNSSAVREIAIGTIFREGSIWEIINLSAMTAITGECVACAARVELRTTDDGR